MQLVDRCRAATLTGGIGTAEHRPVAAERVVARLPAAGGRELRQRLQLKKPQRARGIGTATQDPLRQIQRQPALQRQATRSPRRPAAKALPL